MVRARHGAMGGFAVFVFALSGCAQNKPPAAGASNAAAKSAPIFSLDTPVEHIAADPRGKAVLNRDLPGLMSSRSYLLFDDMSLAEIASLSSGQLTAAKLNKVEADLIQIPAPIRLTQTP